MRQGSAAATDRSEPAKLLAKAVSRWDNEGGAGAGGREQPMSHELPADALPLTNAEIVQLQIRVIALENVLAVLLAEATVHQLALVRQMSAYISPRPGCTSHRLTIHAAARMISLIDGAGHLRKRRQDLASPDASPD